MLRTLPVLLAGLFAVGTTTAAELAFRAPQAVMVSSEQTHVRLLSARLDADQYPDTIAWSNSGAPPYLTLRRGAAGGLAANTETISLASNAGPSVGAAAIGDIDGDGDADIAVIRPRQSDGQQELYFLFNDGNAGFATGSAGDLAVEGAYHLLLADLDEDGLVDLLADRPGTSEIRMWHNLGGSFAPSVTLTAAASADDMAVADVDLDGHVDLILGHYFCCSGGTPGGVMHGNGDGTFAAEVTLPSIDVDVLGIEVGDLDGDGDADLALNWVWSAVSQTLDAGIYRNDSGSFVPVAGTGDLVGECADPTFGDVDADGILDILCSYGHGAVGVRRGLGGFAFAPLVRFQTGVEEYAYYLSVVDVDADGRDDIIAGGVRGQANLIRSTTAVANTPPQVQDLVFDVAPDQVVAFFPTVLDAEGHYVEFENPVAIGYEHGILWLPSTLFEYLAPPLPFTEFISTPNGFRANVVRKVDDVYLFEAYDDRGGRSQFRVTFRVRGESEGGGGGSFDPALFVLLVAFGAMALRRRRTAATPPRG